MKYSFPAIFRKDEEDEKWINVTFPDLLGVVTCGKGMEDAMEMAKDALKCILEIEHVRAIKPSTLEHVESVIKDAETLMVEVEINGTV